MEEKFILSRETYKRIKSFDKNRMQQFIADIYDSAAKEVQGGEAVTLDMDKLRSELSQIKGIGENRLNEIMGCVDCFTLPDSEDTTVPNWSLEPYDEMKWYDWKDHISQLAKEFPYVEFRLEGNGEDRDDW